MKTLYGLGDFEPSGSVTPVPRSASRRATSSPLLTSQPLSNAENISARSSEYIFSAPTARQQSPLPALRKSTASLNPVAALAQALQAPDNAELLQRVNEELRLTAESLKASDVYLMDTTGLTIAASSYRKELSFVGRSFGYRPYFTQAVEGGLGRFFALGTTSGERGYFYAYPVEVGQRIVGVVAVKFLVAPFEEAWRGSDHLVIVRDLNGVVFMSSNPDWHFRTMRPLSVGERERIEAIRQYPVDRMELLPNTASPLRGDMALLSIDVDGQGREFS